MSSSALQSKDHRELLDTIDRLRTKGISKYVDLPQIIVCGDQSAGKSSVLEAISGMSFPTKDNLCTRFPTELILRRDPVSKLDVSITPGTDGTATDKARLSEFHLETDNLTPDLGSIVEGAKEAMALSETKVFSTDTLRVEVCGPSQPHLTMVDLPGLFRAGNTEQSVANAPVVEEMVRTYMKSSRSIILCIVSAKYDFALQNVTELARELDSKGLRTLGLITKPDTLDAGSDGEVSYLKLAQNKDVVFRLGWHVLKNRSYEMRNASSAERDESEAKFFASGTWASVDPMCLGVGSLKTRLSKVLGEQILRQLPGLIEDVEAGISSCHVQLRRLGSPRGSPEEQRRYLVQISQGFSTLMRAAVEGFYNDAFFGSAKSDEGYQKRLRAVVQNTLTDFAQNMRLTGRTRNIVEYTEDDASLPEGDVSRSSYVEEVKALMRRTRGCELPGTFNPLIVGDLFREQCQPWQGIALDAKNIILQAVYWTTEAVVSHIAAEETLEDILRLINARIDMLDTNLNVKIAELLDPHYTGHPITYNHYLTENIQRAQADRNRRKLEQALKDYFDVNKIVAEDFDANPLGLLNLLDRQTQPDMERFASEQAVDYMEAYYKVAEKKFIDDFSDLAIEQCLIQGLASLFDPQYVHEMKHGDVARVAAERAESAAERTSCVEKLSVLESGLQDLRKLDKHHAVALGPNESDRNDAESSGDPHGTPLREAPGDIQGVGTPISLVAKELYDDLIA